VENVLRKEVAMKNVITTIIFVLIPIAIGLPMALVYHDEVYLEVILVVFGLVWFLILIARMNHHDRENKIRTGSFKNDKKSLEYHEYITMQRIMFIAGAISLGLSYLTFFISEYLL
jgi:hypothetical protein